MGDLASGVTLVGSRGGVQPLFVGAAQTLAGSHPASSDVRKYQLCAFWRTGGRESQILLQPFDPGAGHKASQAVIVSQNAKAGASAPYWKEGYFNDAAVIWPSHPLLDTYEKRKAYFNGTGIKIGRVLKT